MVYNRIFDSVSCEFQECLRFFNGIELHEKSHVTFDQVEHFKSLIECKMGLECVADLNSSWSPHA